MGYKTKQPEKVQAEFYVLVEPVWKDAWHTDEAGERVLESAKAVRLTQKRPTGLSRGAVVTKLTLQLDASTFLPLRPEAVIEVLPGSTETILATASDPRESDGE